MRYGLRKITLLDYPGLVACTVFTFGCNFRCPFCHNASLVNFSDGEGSLELGEVVDFLRSRGRKLDGVCVTGGEALMHRDIDELLAKIRELNLRIKVDTNGSFPEALQRIIDAGLVDYVAMDIKNSPEKYAVTCGKDDVLEKVKQSVDILMHSGKVDYEFRTTVVDAFHEEADFAAIGKWIAGAKRYFLQEFVDSGDLLDKVRPMAGLSEEKMQACLDRIKNFVPNSAIRGI